MTNREKLAAASDDELWRLLHQAQQRANYAARNTWRAAIDERNAIQHEIDRRARNKQEEKQR